MPSFFAPLVTDGHSFPLLLPMEPAKDPTHHRVTCHFAAEKVTIITIHKENVAIPQAQERYHHHHHLNFQRVNMGKSTISIRAIETIANCNKLLEAMRYD
jgi:hypothetical protein